MQRQNILENISEIEFLASGKRIPKLAAKKSDESTPLVAKVKAYCIPSHLAGNYCLMVPGTDGYYRQFQIPIGSLIPFAIGPIIENKDTVQQIVNAVNSYLEEQKEKNTASFKEAKDDSNDDEEVGVGMEAVELKPSRPNNARGVLPVILAGGISAVVGELLELAVFKDVDNKLPLPFWMVAASVCVMLALCYQHCCKCDNASSLLNQYGKFRLQKRVADTKSHLSVDVGNSESSPLLQAQPVRTGRI